MIAEALERLLELLHLANSIRPCPLRREPNDDFNFRRFENVDDAESVEWRPWYFRPAGTHCKFRSWGEIVVLALVRHIATHAIVEQNRVVFTLTGEERATV